MLIAFNILLLCFTVQLFIYLANQTERERKSIILERILATEEAYIVENAGFSFFFNFFFFINSWWYDWYKAL